MLALFLSNSNESTLHDTPRGYKIATMIEDLKRRALHRSKIIQGQIRGLERMIDDEAYCADIITQSLAIQKSLGSLNKLILENHLRTHIREKYASGNAEQQKEAVDELLTLYELTNIRGNNNR